MFGASSIVNNTYLIITIKSNRPGGDFVTYGEVEVEVVVVKDDDNWQTKKNNNANIRFLHCILS